MRKTLLSLCTIALIAVWCFVPWNEVQTDGTGDGILTYDRLKFGFIWQLPTATKSVISTSSKVWVQPDWVVLLAETLVIVGIGVFVYFKNKPEDEPKDSAE
ncbi:MAG TPA: hypothetical protein V6C76_06900 [Drouetiella sp.]